jgi:solute carrier family 35, member F5
MDEGVSKWVKYFKLPKSSLILGYICLAVVVVQWVTSGFVAQFVYQDLDYRCTIAQSVYTLCFYSVLLIPHVYRSYVKRSDAPLTSTSAVEFVFSTKAKVLCLGCLWLGAQIIYVMSLLYTSMGTNTAVSSSSSAFSFVFSILLLGYSFRVFSAIGVALTIGGVVLTALFRAEPSETLVESSDQFIVTETVEGIIMAVCAAGCFGLFSCLFKKWVKNDDYGGIVFGSFGLVAFSVGIPIVVIAHFSGLQAFIMPDWKVWLTVTADAVMCCFVNNVCLSRAFIYLTPVIVLVGLTMTVPLSIFADTVIFSNHSYSKWNIVGISLITLAVLIVGYDQAKFELSLEERKEEIATQ